MASVLRAFALLCGILFSCSTLAAAVVETVTGTVRSGPSATSTNPVAIGQRIDPGTTIVTGPKSLATLRFDDGQAMLLYDETEFRVNEYAFTTQEPARDRFKFDLLRGAIRSVTALLTKRNPQAYQLFVPQATFGIRGTDFMVALVNSAYLSVLDGTVSASNAAGTTTFAAGSTAAVASPNTLAVPIADTALPASVAAAFKEMNSIVLSATGTATGPETTLSGSGTSATPPAGQVIDESKTDKPPVSGFGSGNPIGIGAGIGGPSLGGPGMSPGISPAAGPALGGPMGPAAGFGKGPSGPAKP